MGERELWGAGGQHRAVTHGRSWRRQSGGWDNGRVVRWHRSAQLSTVQHGWAQFGTAPCASSWAQPRAAGAEGNTAVCPLSPRVTGQLHWVDRGALVPQCHTPQCWVLGGLCSRLCSHRCWSEEAVAAGGWELLAPSLDSGVGPAGSCLLEPAGEGWPVPLAIEKDVK